MFFFVVIKKGNVTVITERASPGFRRKTVCMRTHPPLLGLPPPPPLPLPSANSQQLVEKTENGRRSVTTFTTYLDLSFWGDTFLRPPCLPGNKLRFRAPPPTPHVPSPPSVHVLPSQRERERKKRERESLHLFALIIKFCWENIICL